MESFQRVRPPPPLSSASVFLFLSILDFGAAGEQTTEQTTRGKHLSRGRARARARERVSKQFCFKVIFCFFFHFFSLLFVLRERMARRVPSGSQAACQLLPNMNQRKKNRARAKCSSRAFLGWFIKRQTRRLSLPDGFLPSPANSSAPTVRLSFCFLSLSLSLSRHVHVVSPNPSRLCA